MQSMGANPELSRLALRGNLSTDTGIRHPWIPVNAPLHAMPAQGKREIGKRILQEQQRGVEDVAHAIANPGALSGARMTRGMMGLGQTQHGLMDLGAHFERPLEAGMTGEAAGTLQGRAAGRLRKVLQKVPGAEALGPVVSGMEHQTAGLKGGRGLAPGSHLDTFVSGGTASDVRSASRAAGFGRAAKRKVLKVLQTTHGMSPEAAEAAYLHHMSSKAPGRVSQLLGKASRDVGHITERTTAPVRAAATVGKKAVGTLGKVAPALKARALRLLSRRS